MEEHRENMHNTGPNPETWDKIAESYNMDIDCHETELVEEIKKILLSLNIKGGSSLLELGSGSGHLSGLLSGHGYNVTLLDFSKKAIEKSEQFFRRHHFSGNFVLGDLTRLSSAIGNYDVMWNSGVMEHFNDSSLERVLESIRNTGVKYFIFLVPNPLSLPYLMFRYKLISEGKWVYGIEYLRTDYDVFLAKAGFRLLEQRFLGWNYTYNLLEYALSAKEPTQIFRTLVENNYVPVYNAYLTAYISILDNQSNHPDNADLKNYKGITEKVTEEFDNLASMKH